MDDVPIAAVFVKFAEDVNPLERKLRASSSAAPGIRGFPIVTYCPKRSAPSLSPRLSRSRDWLNRRFVRTLAVVSCIRSGAGGFLMGDQISKAYNDHNVYILGAGFSAEAGLPLIKDFMNRMRDAASWLEEQGDRKRELEAIRRVFEFRLKAAAAAHRFQLNIENVEELFSLASASGDPELAEAMPLAIAATLDYAKCVTLPLADHEYFQIGMLNVPGWRKPSNWKPPTANVQEGVRNGNYKGEWYGCPPYEFYVGVMCSYFNKGGSDRRDTIITFNYDQLVEESCHDLGIPVGYGLQVSRDNPDQALLTAKQDAKVQILKLHGSLNWANFAEHLRSSNEEARLVCSSGQVEDWEVARGWPGPRVFKDYSGLREEGLSPLLLPPTWRKDLGIDQYGRIDFSNVWDAAVTALRTATNVIILGYSIPQTDLHFKYLLAAGLQDNISLRKVFFVNRGLAEERARRQLEERLFGLFRRELFDQDVVTLVRTDLREFLAGPREMNEDSHRVRIGRPLNPPGCTWGTSPWTFFLPYGRGWSIE